MNFFKKLFTKEKKESLDKGLKKSNESFFSALTLYVMVTGWPMYKTDSEIVAFNSCPNPINEMSIQQVYISCLIIYFGKVLQAVL